MKHINWGWKIVIAYTLFIAGTLSWVGYAMTKEVDLVRPDYYQHSLDQDQTSAALGRAHALKAAASISLDKAENVFIIQIPAEHAAEATGTVSLYRPNSNREDRTVALKTSASGQMLISTVPLSKGLWRVTLDWSYNKKAYQLFTDDTL